MSKKRALSASPSPTPELDVQHRNKVPKTDILQGRLLDPVYHLNGDILNMVFDRLPIADAFSCASLNKAWEAVALRWMHQTRSLVGQKLRSMCYEAVPVSLWQGLSIAEIKYYASNLSRAQSAKATSLFSCHGPVGFVDVGDFAANLSRGDPKYSDFHSVLHWRPLHPLNHFQHESKTYEIPELSERFGRGTVIALFVNRNGVIVVNLQYLGAQTNRLLVYCPIDEKRLWDYPYNSHITCPNSPSVIVPVPFGPVALGQSYAYCVSTEAHSGWALMAYDFRTGKEVYRISKGVQWFRSANTWLAEGRPVPERLVRLVEVNGEELLVLMSEPRLTETTVEIIRGRDGQPLYSIEYSPFWKLGCLADSLTNQVALIWYKPAERAANAGRSITLIRTFSYQPGQPFTLSPLIAVERKTPCSEYETLQPFTMTDIEVVTLASEKRGKFTIARSCLIQVDSQRIRNLALQAAIDLFDHAPRQIRCYTTDSPRTVTVSGPGSSSSPGSQNSDILSVDTVPTPAVYWLDHARLVVQTMNYTRIVQF